MSRLSLSPRLSLRRSQGDESGSHEAKTNHYSLLVVSLSKNSLLTFQRSSIPVINFFRVFSLSCFRDIFLCLLSSDFSLLKSFQSFNTSSLSKSLMDFPPDFSKVSIHFLTRTLP